jgi:hypothetical protein
MKKIAFISILMVIASLLIANDYKFYTIDVYQKDELLTEEVGGLYVNTTLADSTSEFWTYRVFQDSEDYLEYSCRSSKGIEKIPAGKYEVRFPFNHLEYPVVPNVQIVEGYVTVVDVYIGGRVYITTNKPAVTFHLINMDNGVDTGKNEKIIYNGDVLIFDVVPGNYQLYITNIFSDPSIKPDSPMEEPIKIDFKLKPWKIHKVKI